MKSLLACLFFVAVAHAASILGQDDKWEEFKKDYNKKYSPEDEIGRRKIFDINLEKVKEHNNNGQHNYELAINEFADLTVDEYQKMLLGYRPELQNSSTVERFFLPLYNVLLPEKIDWRDEGYVTPVKNQGQCGSCWAFSATGSLEGQHFRKTKKLVSLSEQNLVDCSKDYGNNGCEGGLMDNAFKYIKANGGIDTEKSYPYKERDGRCKFSQADVGATCTGYKDIQKGSETQLKQAAGTIGPISVAIDASHSSFQLYSKGVYDEPDCSSSQLDHGVLVVGYGTSEAGEDYWLVKNSWGASWGMNGYIMMSRNKDNQCGIATAASYPLV